MAKKFIPIDAVRVNLCVCVFQQNDFDILLWVRYSYTHGPLNVTDRQLVFKVCLNGF